MSTMKDLIAEIEAGGIKFEYNHQDMQKYILFTALRNRVYLEHIIEELYTNKKKRKAKFKELEEKFMKQLHESVADLAMLNKP
ncbi:hypothetical protein WSM22_03480 [Cytophagales bacterium WSM2-2]|nr:hypothetical protein WSM22_03480 [Cytophagales bacterium WSM2-2]